MMRFLTILFVCFLLPLSAQNLVPNGSFELSMKPVVSKYAGNIEQALPWFPAGIGSPDLIHQNDVPNGQQLAAEGQQFAGLILYDADNHNFREYLEVRLIRALIPGEEVCIRFQVSAAEESMYFTDELGIALSNDSIRSRDWNTITLDPELKTQKFLPISDTGAAWKKISFTYKAKGGEQFITLGNFRNDESTSLQPNNQTLILRLAYLYIDDVFVGSCAPEKPVEIDTPISINPPPSSEILPAGKMHVPTMVTPNGDGFNDVFYIEGLPRYSRLIIRNKQGNQVYKTDNYRNDWDGSGLKNGTYQYELILPDGNRIDGPLDVVRRK